VAQIDKTLVALAAHMNPGEVFITNADRHQETVVDPATPILGGETIASECMATGKWLSVRVIDVAFDVTGKLCPKLVSVVGVPKKQ